MRIAAQGEATAHVDTNYYWQQRVRVHVPVLTSADVQFVCGDRAVHMAAGETWIFDTWRLHNVLNPSARDRIHLVADTVGSATFWELAAQADLDREATFIGYQAGLHPELDTESVNFPVVMTPWEQECLLVRILDDLARASSSVERSASLEAALERFHRQWRALWAQHGDAPSGWPAFEQLLHQFDVQLAAWQGQMFLPNGVDAVGALRQGVVRPALNTDLAREAETATRAPVTLSPCHLVTLSAPKDRFDRPIFILAAPRSGSTLLFETLARSPGVWTIGDESHEVFERIAKFDPMRRGFDSNRLTAADYDGDTAAALRGNFLALLRDRDGRPLPAEHDAVRLLEKTPKNALRTPFLDAVFPDALFIYLYREPHENISSILEAWKSGRFVTYPRLPDWEGPPWSLLLIPQWRELRGKSLVEIAAEQWATANRCLLDDLAQLSHDRWTTVSYAELTADPQGAAERLCRFAGVRWDQQLRGSLPLSRHTLTPPDPNKWRRNAALLQSVLAAVEPIAARARQVVAMQRSRAA
jgi:hypothetical protein